MSLTIRSLSKIKSLKNKVTQQAHWSYACAIDELKQAEDELLSIQAVVDEANEEWGRSQKQTNLSIDVLMGWYRIHTSLMLQEQKQAAEVEACRENSESQQLKLIQCFQEEQIWDKLLTRKQQEWSTQINKVQQDFLDEVASSRYNRN